MFLLIHYLRKHHSGDTIKMKKKNTNLYYLLRISRNKEVKELATALKVTSAYINAIENGDRIPSPELRKLYSETLNIDEDVICYIEEKIKTNKFGFEPLLFTLLSKITNIIQDENSNT